MRIQPRQQLLEIWRATIASSYPGKSWRWGGRELPNSVSDAEQLLCLLLPATNIDDFRIANADETAEDVLRALRAFGNAMEIPRHLVGVLNEYYDRYSEGDGTPRFRGGSYFSTVKDGAEPTPEQLDLDVVESFAVSIPLTLATISFVRSYASTTTREDSRAEAEELERRARLRLTAALVGLMRSFSVNAFDMDTEAGRYLLATVNQEELPDRDIASSLSARLRDVTATLRELVGSDQAKDLDSPDRLYECGWSWGIVHKAETYQPITDARIRQQEGYAEDAPYLYFTVVALDGLADLFAPSTRQQRLLTEEQQQLAADLRIRWDMTQSYWATIGSFGGKRWALEDLPWRTTDGAQSNYFSLLVTSIAVRDLEARRGTDLGLSRLGQVLKNLASRGRITSRPEEQDVAQEMHWPGVPVSLGGSDAYGPTLQFRATDFAPLLLKRVVQVADLLKNGEMRREVVDLADEVWDHLLLRRGADQEQDTWRGLWDQPARGFDIITEHFAEPSWHHTFRVVETMRVAARLISADPLPALEVVSLATSMLAEAEHLLDQEHLAGSSEAGNPLRDEIRQIRSNVTRARTIIASRPSSAVALLEEGLRALDRIAAARQERAGVA